MGKSQVTLTPFLDDRLRIWAYPKELRTLDHNADDSAVQSLLAYLAPVTHEGPHFVFNCCAVTEMNSERKAPSLAPLNPCPLAHAMFASQIVRHCCTSLPRSQSCTERSKPWCCGLADKRSVVPRSTVEQKQCCCERRLPIDSDACAVETL
eukprot:5064129-Amphidinium_carterae.1